MKRFHTAFFTLFFCISAFMTQAQIMNRPRTALVANDPWTAKELLEPGVLAAQIKAGKATGIKILNIGPMDDIAGATHIGAVGQAEHLEKLRDLISGWPKNTHVVVYCGCCPFYKCPNIRPAYKTLKSAHFTNVQLLSLDTNLETDWIKKGYPLKD
ncbi:MAG: rhodanese-like domain-containing protein [Mucilaginibacter polytrichastri]|nr:rhodanese-like domain-containing protein [Mucilaginibacter polytrichastri]